MQHFFPIVMSYCHKLKLSPMSDDIVMFNMENYDSLCSLVIRTIQTVDKTTEAEAHMT